MKFSHTLIRAVPLALLVTLPATGTFAQEVAQLPVPPAPPAAPSGPLMAQAAPAPAAPAAPAARAQPSPRAAPAPRPAPATPARAHAPEVDESLRRPPTEEESLALAAIEGLMSMPTERALPLLRKVLAGSQSVLVKRRALFVVGQIDNDEALTLLLETARNGASPLRRDAIRNIGIHGNPKGLKALPEIYASGDARVKQEVLSAWLIAGRKDEIYQVAATARDEKEVSQAIRTLSAMGAREELRKLADVQKSHRGLVQAYAVAGDLESLLRIAQGNGELANRVEAVRSIGIIGSDAARKALRDFYLAAGEKPLREAALHGLQVAGDQQGVLALYRAARSGEEKRALLRALSAMGGDAALDAIDAALEGRK